MTDQERIKALEKELEKFKSAMDSIRILADKYASQCGGFESNSNYGFRLIEMKAEKTMYE